MSGVVRELRPLEGRVPPAALDAEGAVLSAILLSADAFDTIQDILKPEHFYADANRHVFSALSELRSQGQPADGVTVANRLKSNGRLDQVGGSPYLAVLTNLTPSVANVEAHALLVRDKWELRRMIAVCQKVAAEGYGEIPDVQAFKDRAEHALFSLTSGTSKNDNAGMQTVVEETLKEIEFAASIDGVVGVATGISEWDHKTTGMRGGEVHVLAGRPGMGKTALALDIAINAARDSFGVQVFSLEMQRRALGMRMLASAAEINLLDVRGGKITPNDLSVLKEAALDIATLPIYISDKSAPTVLSMRAIARRKDAELRREGQKLGLIVVDYVQLAQGMERDQGREREVASLMAGLKHMARDFDVPVLVISQLNRSLEARPDKRPLLSDLRESGSIEQDADVVVFVYRDEYYSKEKCKAPGRAELIIAKQRNGPLCTIEVGFDAEHAHFYELSSAPSAAATQEAFRELPF